MLEVEGLVRIEPDEEQRERLLAALRGDPDDTPPPFDFEQEGDEA